MISKKVTGWVVIALSVISLLMYGSLFSDMANVNFRQAYGFMNTSISSMSLIIIVTLLVVGISFLFDKRR